MQLVPCTDGKYPKVIVAPILQTYSWYLSSIPYDVLYGTDTDGIGISCCCYIQSPKDVPNMNGSNGNCSFYLMAQMNCRYSSLPIPYDVIYVTGTVGI